ncbi:MAG: protein tyrosine phosphatase [Pseudomonadota bacterium]
MIIVACKNDAERLAAEHPNARVISVVDDVADAPEIAGVRADRRLILSVEDQCLASNGSVCANAAKTLLSFIQDWSPEEGPLLLHCERGVSRSTAAAFIAMCAKAPDADECDLATRLRQAAPHADPNILLVNCGDEALGRGGRMVDAVLSLPDDPPPPCGAPARISIEGAC